MPRPSQRTLGRKLLSNSELPEWLRGNGFLSHFHRPPTPSFKSCFKRIFKIHSETVNIWNHLVCFNIFDLHYKLHAFTANTPHFLKADRRSLYLGVPLPVQSCVGVFRGFFTPSTVTLKADLHGTLCRIRQV